MQFINDLFGLDADKLTAFQMSARALLVFVTTLVYVKIAGIRTFSKKSTFDQITSLIMGTLMGNAIFNSNIPFFPLLLASLVIMLLHRILAIISFFSKSFEKIVKGTPLRLIKSGQVQIDNMKRVYMTENDLKESMRMKLYSEDLNKVEEAFLEPAGDVSFVKKEE